MSASTERSTGNWNDVVGPFLDIDGVRAQLEAASIQTVLDAVSRDELLALPANRLLFPRFQFDETPHGLPHLPVVLNVLRTAFESPWSHAVWLNTPVPSWGEKTPAHELAAGHHERVLARAHTDTERRRR